MKHYDLTVVGGSFAGLACAREAALQGLKTNVYERKATPGAYTQSTGLLVKEVAQQLSIPEHLTRKITGVRLYAPNMQFIDLTSPNYYFLATDTGALLEWMARQVKIAGGVVHSGESVGTSTNSIIATEKKILLPQQQTSCSYLVCADGARSKLARQLQLGVNRHFLCGAEYEVMGFEHVDSDKLHVFLDSEHAPGYIGWLVPGVHAAQVGIAVKPSCTPKLQPFLEKLARHFNAKTSIVCGRGGLIPCGGIVSPMARGNICLLGDAAGMVSPLTAGGIHPAIEQGTQLGQYIADYLRYNAPAPDKALRDKLPKYRTKQLLRALYNRYTPSNDLLNYSVTNPLFKRIAQVIFFHNRGLLCREAWRDILWGTH